MDEPTNRQPFQTLRPRTELRSTPLEDRVQAPEDPAEDTSTPAVTSRRRKDANTANQFTGSSAPAQFKLPADLLQSLKLHAISTNETMSEIVLRCLTTTDVIEKAWISTRKAG